MGVFIRSVLLLCTCRKGKVAAEDIFSTIKYSKHAGHLSCCCLHQMIKKRDRITANADTQTGRTQSILALLLAYCKPEQNKRI